MSLPPLVCNTPPPPDQCEDEKDPEDFDINYNLSQDDDEDSNGFGFQTYSTYNVYKPSKSDTIQECHWPPSLNNTFENNLTDNLNEKNKETEPITPILNSLCQKLTLDDVTVEDLNLVISQEDDVNPSIMHIEKSEEDTSHSDISSGVFVNNTDIKTVETDTSTTNFEINQIENVSKIDSSNTPSPEVNEPVDTKSQESDEAVDDFTDFSSNLDSKDEKTDVPQSIVDSYVEKVTESLENEDQTTDDFGDFDDFQFVSNGNNATTYVETNDNPWDHETETTDFGDFKANFDENIVEDPSTSVAITNVENNIQLENQIAENDDDDDFGDFDDFKSCAKQSSQSEQIENLQQQVPVLDFHSPDSESQILDSINNILSSIFSEEISEPESPEFVGKLESVLNETWGHLVEMDVRQPYMVNWNNSLGQKSLLKALCIDSRNILFGPKWNYNMPKYAVNLSAAPLQPQKQVTSPVTQPDMQNSHKSVTKESDTWTDPFSSNGQEFTYAEALLLDLEHLMATLDQMAHKHSTLKISELLSHACSNESEATTTERRVNDMEVFEKVTPPKMDKVYPPPLTVQPLRQINLPDTHIFTPSDSETPRSKTIHYDNGPPIALTQTVVNNDNFETARPQSPKTVNNLDSDNDYWEFQDFKSTTEPVATAEKVSQISDEPVSDLGSNSDKENNKSLSVPYQPNILQPIKVETIAPTLNWPNPGEVNDSFDDFTDFVSSAPWENSEKDVRSMTHENNIHSVDPGNSDAKNNEISANIEVNHDDEFETFQSAPIPSQSNQLARKNSGSEVNYQPSTSKTIDFDPSFSGKFNAPSAISMANNVTVKNNTSYAAENHNSNVGQLRDGFVTNSPIHSMETNILQPLPATSSTSVSRPASNTGQILQPLSLESYSQINWPNPGIDLQDLSRFNPVETLPSLKSEPSYGQSKVNSPAHENTRNETPDDDIWGDFVSSKPAAKKPPVFGDEDEWTDFVSSPSVKPQNGVNTISFNVHTNLSMQKSTHPNKLSTKNNQISLDIPTLNYITPKSNHKAYNERHFQNL